MTVRLLRKRPSTAIQVESGVNNGYMQNSGGVASSSSAIEVEPGVDNEYMQDSGALADKILCCAWGELKYTSVDAGSQCWKQGYLQLSQSTTGQYVCILNFNFGRSLSFPVSCKNFSSAV